MIPKKLLEDYLEASYVDIYSRGLKYFESGRVSSVTLSDDYVSAEVSGSRGMIYDVSISFDIENEYIESECDCPYDRFCKHEVALCLYLINQSKSEVKRIKKDKAKKFKQKKCNVFRPLEDQGDIYTTITSYSSKHPTRLSWGEIIEGQLLQGEVLEIQTNIQGYYHNIKKFQKAALKIIDGILHVKCLSCIEVTDKLCDFQSGLLLAASPILSKIKIDQPGFSFKKITENMAELEGMSSDVFYKYYNIKLNSSGLYVQAKKNFVSADWLNKTNDMLNLDYNKENKKAQQDFSKQLDGRPPRYAFLWSWGDDTFPSVSFISGYALKTKKGIHGTDRRIEDLPIHLPKEYKDIGQRLACLQSDTDLKESFSVGQSIIDQNIDRLNSIYQYTLSPSYSYGNIASKDLSLFQFVRDQLICRFTCKQEDGLIHLSRHLCINDRDINYQKDVSYSNLLFSIIDGQAYLHANYSFHDLMIMFGEHETLIFSNKEYRKLVKLINQLQSTFEVDIITDNILPEEIILQHPEYQIYLKEVGNFITFEPKMLYREGDFNPLHPNLYTLKDKKYVPDDQDVTFFIDFLKKAHPNFNKLYYVQDYVYLDGHDLLNDNWFLNFCKTCDATGITLLGQKKLKKFNYSTKSVRAVTHVRSGIDWFDVNMELSFGDETVKVSDWIKAIKNKESFVILKDGSIGMMPEKWINQVRKILSVSEKEDGEYKISKYRFNVIDEIFDQIDDKKLIKEIKQKKKKLIDYNFGKTYNLPKRINAKLRDYQLLGYQWLKFLDEIEFGGILADDMGLGKTLQVISLLANQKSSRKKLGTSLVIVPKTLLFNWSAEIEKFCPTLEHFIHHGSARNPDLSDYHNLDVIITTYGTVVSDIEKFKNEEYNYIILDESQAIKNPNSQRYKAVRLLKSRNKLAMTGTPIENNTMDLYAQLSFTSPGLLGTKNHFKQNFAIPIDNNRDAGAAALLRKMIHPFLLRRTKDQVAQDLPEKTESIIYCEMADAQRKLYNNLKEKIKKDINQTVEEKGLAKSKFKMLDGLLRLRQMCNSPLLVNDSFRGVSAESVKINMLCETITENLEGHSVLVFSQFVSLLSLVRKELEKRDLPYAYLDGSTRNRKKEVEKFMNDDTVNIFLISIKAGNTGMNLTKADYVYILDPWWNPAVEAQAIDRTHRIGQDKNVFSYKMICKDTIEEKIMKLQERKKEIASDIIKVDENVLKSLNKSELLDLFD